MPIPIAGALEDGLGALSKGEWEAARERFSVALERDETPEALEGLSWAGWWLNDPELTMSARERAYHLYKGAGDFRGAARMAMWLASDHLEFRGELAIGAGWRRRARRLLEGIEHAAEHGWLALHEGAIALEVDDDTSAAKKFAADASDIGRALDLIDLEALALAMRGLAEVSEGNVDEGMRYLDEAGVSATSGELDDVISVGWVCCYLIYACERVRDFDRAAQWCDKMQELSKKLQTHYWAPVCRTHYAVMLTWRGDYAAAEKELTRATESLVRSVRPPAAAEAMVRLAELRRRQGHLDEAKALFEEVSPHPLASLGQAEIFLMRARPEDARDVLERSLRRTPAENLTQRAPILEVLVRAQADAGDLDGADASLTALRVMAKKLSTTPIRAAARLGEGVVLRAKGLADEARKCFEDAIDLFGAVNAPFETARARIELALSLVALDRTDAAEDALRVAQVEFERLKATAELERVSVVLQRIAGKSRVRASSRGALALLTDRQREVLTLIADGQSDKEIAATLRLSQHTVHRHVANILGKLSVPSRGAAAAYAARHGLLEKT